MLTKEQKTQLKSSFEEGSLKIQSVSPQGVVEWKRVFNVSRSEVFLDPVYEIQTKKGPLVITGGHKVFTDPTSKIKSEDLVPGDNVLGIENEESVSPKILSISKKQPRRYMYDLTVEDWHNFLCERSGIVISNCPDKFYHFRPPEHEGRIGRFNRVFGQIWEDEELNEYLETALDWWNMMPPRTRELCSIEALLSSEPAWSAVLIWRAIVHAVFALTLNWIADEFSFSSRTNLNVYIPGEEAITVSAGELYEIQKEIQEEVSSGP